MDFDANPGQYGITSTGKSYNDHDLGGLASYMLNSPLQGFDDD
jgi:hypothetical protein